MTLYPLNLGYELPRPQHSHPILAERETASKILDDVVAFSKPYDTEIYVESERTRIES